MATPKRCTSPKFHTTMNELITVIVPVHNKERYLAKCLKSILRQSYTDLEIIVVDDSSSDGSKRIIEEYADKDSRIKVIESSSKLGALHCRYEAIKVALGQRMVFVDADDWIEPQAVERLNAAMDLYDVDMVQMRHRRVMSGMKVKYYEHYDRELAGRRFDGEEFKSLASYVGMDSLIAPPFWGKIYRTEIIKSNPLPDFRQFWGEDQIFNIQYLLHAKSIAFIDYKGYNYRWGGETSSNYRYAALRDYKYVHYLKKVLGQRQDYINEELLSLLRYHIRQLNTELGWTREAIIMVMEDELQDPVWQQAGLTATATELVTEQLSEVQRHMIKYMVKRLLR